MKNSTVTSSILSLSVGAAVLVSGCGSKAEYVPVKAAEPTPVKMENVTAEELLGIKPGKKWTYALTSVIQNREGTRTENDVLEITVTKFVQRGARKIATMEYARNNKVIDRQDWEVGETGVFQRTTGLKPVTFSTPVPIVPFPLTSGKVVSWQGKGMTVVDELGTIRSKVRVRGVESVDTAAGKRSGIAVEAISEFQAGKTKGSTVSTTWFTPGVGIVRLRQALTLPNGGITTTLSLSRES